jgi:hypothetical protein
VATRSWRRATRYATPRNSVSAQDAGRDWRRIAASWGSEEGRLTFRSGVPTNATATNNVNSPKKVIRPIDGLVVLVFMVQASIFPINS